MLLSPILARFTASNIQNHQIMCDPSLWRSSALKRHYTPRPRASTCIFWVRKALFRLILVLVSRKLSLNRNIDYSLQPLPIVPIVDTISCLLVLGQIYFMDEFVVDYVFLLEWRYILTLCAYRKQMNLPKIYKMFRCRFRQAHSQNITD